MTLKNEIVHVAYNTSSDIHLVDEISIKAPFCFLKDEPQDPGKIERCTGFLELSHQGSNSAFADSKRLIIECNPE